MLLPLLSGIVVGRNLLDLAVATDDFSQELCFDCQAGGRGPKLDPAVGQALTGYSAVIAKLAASIGPKDAPQAGPAVPAAAAPASEWDGSYVKAAKYAPILPEGGTVWQAGQPLPYAFQRPWEWPKSDFSAQFSSPYFDGATYETLDVAGAPWDFSSFPGFHFFTSGLAG